MEQTNPPLVMWLILACNLTMLLLAVFSSPPSVENAQSIQDQDRLLCFPEFLTQQSQP
ncbi:MAG: hypothetical protein GVY17_14490 [Cyanobacteria bacterium]|jgi:hypothetical protein|nr:hypothetical protein [Cyanobacteria bacterium GSL.Bin21]